MVSVFSTESAEFSDKTICHYSKMTRTCHLLRRRPQRQQDTCERQLNSCFSDLPDSMNLIN